MCNLLFIMFLFIFWLLMIILMNWIALFFQLMTFNIILVFFDDNLLSILLLELDSDLFFILLLLDGFKLCELYYFCFIFFIRNTALNALRMKSVTHFALL